MSQKTFLDIIDSLPPDIAPPELKEQMKRRLEGESKDVWKSLCALMLGKAEIENQDTGQKGYWDPILDAASVPDGFIRLFRLLGVSGDQWKNCGLLRNRAALPVEQRGLGLSEPVARIITAFHSKICERFGSHKRFVAKMEGKEGPERTIRRLTAESWSQSDFGEMLKRYGLRIEDFRDSDFLTSRQSGDAKNAFITIVQKFCSARLFVAFMETETWSPSIDTIIKIGLFSKEEFLQFFQKNNIEGFWKDRNRVIDIAEKEICGESSERRFLPEFLMAIQMKCNSYQKFAAYLDPQHEGKNLSWEERIEQCRNPLDFIVLFVDEKVPGNKWENSEWMSTMAKKSSQEGGINNNLSSFVNVIRADKRFGGSYPNFVAWMYGRKEAEKSIAARVADFQTPDDAKIVLKELGIPLDDACEYMKIVKRGEEAGTSGQENAGIHGYLLGVLKRWKKWRYYKAWFQESDTVEMKWAEQVRGCQTSKKFLDLFSSEGIPGELWRNTNWLMNIAKLPEEQGGIGKNFRGLMKAIESNKRFGKFTKFIAWMDGMPLGGITTIREAHLLLATESERLGVPVETLLEEKEAIRHWRKSPLFVALLEFVTAHQMQVGENEQPGVIAVADLLEKFQSSYEDFSKTYLPLLIRKRGGEMLDVVRRLRDRFIAIIQESGDLHNDLEMEALCKKLQKATVSETPRERMRPLLGRITQDRLNARRELCDKANWNIPIPLRIDDNLTERGIFALNVFRQGNGMQVIRTESQKRKNKELFQTQDVGEPPLTIERAKELLTAFLADNNFSANDLADPRRHVELLEHSEFRKLLRFFTEHALQKDREVD